MPSASILVVEDERIVSKDIQLTLQSLGYTICGAAYNARDAIRQAIDAAPDVILMDIMLNDELTGIEAATAIQAQKNIPLIYLTAYTDDDILRKAGITHPFGYILKPFTERELRTAIEMALYKSQLEHQTRQREHWFSTALRSIGDAVIATDANCRIVFLNQHAVALTGWSEQEAIGVELDRVFPVVREVDNRPVSHAKDILAGKSIVDSSEEPLLLIARTGGVPIEATETPIRDDAGTITGVVVVFRDMSEQRNSRREVFELARLARENPSPVLRIGEGGRILYANPSGSALIDVWQARESGKVPEHIAQAVDSVLEMRASTKLEELTDNQRLYALTLVPYPDEHYVHLYANDITELRRTDTALQESHRRFRAMLENVPLISLLLDSNGRISFCNEYFSILVGHPREELSGIDWFDNFVPDYLREASRARFMRYMKEGYIPPSFESKIIGAGGLKRHITWTTTVLRDNAGNTVGMAGVGIDITERRMETLALRHSEERYRQLVEMSPFGIAVHQNGKLVFCNPAAARIIGANSPAELTGRSIIDFIAPEFRPIALERVAQSLANATVAGLLEEQYVRLDGKLIDVEVVTIPTVYSHRPAAQSVFIDISSRKQSQREGERQFVRLQSLYDLLYRAGHSQSIEELYESGLRTLERTLDVTHSALLLFDPIGVMRFVAWHNLSDEYRQHTEGHSCWQPDDPAPAAIFIDDVQTDGSIDSLRDALLKEGIGALAFIPLVVDGTLIGKFKIYFDTPHTFTQEEKLLIETIASHIEFAASGIKSDIKLRESEEKFRSVSEKTSALIAIFRDKYLYINPAFERLTGYSAAEALQMPYNKILDPTMYDGTLEDVERVGVNRQSVRRECLIRTRQGENRWLDVMIDTIPYGGEDAIFLTGVDITERRRNELLIEAQKDILQMIAHGDELEAIFPAVSSFVEQQSPHTVCLVYVPDDEGIFRPFDTTLPAHLVHCLPAGVGRNDTGFIAEAIQSNGHISDCLVLPNANGEPDVRTACAYPVIDSKKDILGVVVVVGGTFEGFSPSAIRVIQIAAQLTSIVLERDLTFEALEKALQKNFRRVVQNLQNHVFKIERQANGEMYYTFSEGRMAEAANMLTENVEDKPLSELYTSEVYSIILPHLERAFAGEAVTFEEHFDNRWFLTTYEPFLNGDGGVEEIIGSSVEITSQKIVEGDLRTSEERYKLIVDTLPIGIMKMIQTDNGWDYEYTNAQALVQTGYNPEDLRNEGSTRAVHPDDRAALSDRWYTWLRDSSRKAMHLTYRFRHKNGHYIWLDNYAVKTINPHTKFQEVIQMVMDITEQKKAEQELRTALTKERELSNLKTRFVSTVSHEFRTPLTGILMSTELLERYYEKLDQQQRQDEVAKIKIRVNELTELMDDFLLQSSVQSMAERFRPELIDFADLATHCVHELRSFLSESPHTLLTTIPENLPMIHGDPKLLRHVVQNLLSNAIKYSPTDSTIHFEVRFDSTAVSIEVRDRGIGIPQEEVSRLFTPFFRASNTGKIKGTGLGLSIIKEFVEIHDGTIKIWSEVGQGTSVVVRLPLTSRGTAGEQVESTEYGQT